MVLLICLRLLLTHGAWLLRILLHWLLVVLILLMLGVSCWLACVWVNTIILRLVTGNDGAGRLVNRSLIKTPIVALVVFILVLAIRGGSHG